MVIDENKLVNVSVLKHDLQELHYNLRGRADQDLEKKIKKKLLVRYEYF